MRHLPKDDDLKPIRPLKRVTVADWLWIEIDETKSRSSDKGLDKVKRMKFRIPKHELESSKIKYANKNLKIICTKRN